jgi:tetratricopeptide (TPR) repeat protein
MALVPLSDFYYSQDVAQRQSYYDDTRMEDLKKSLAANTDRLIEANVATGAAIAASARADAQMLGGKLDEGFNLLDSTLDAGFGALDRTLWEGFQGLERQIGAMSASINFNLVRMNQTLDKIVEQLDGISFSLDNPRYIKARELYRAAEKNCGKKLFEEARDDLLKAVSPDMEKTDYFSWFLLGKVYLFGTSEFSTAVDLDEAVKALENAVKYISATAQQNDEAKPLAAEICFYLGLARLFKAKDLLHKNPDNHEEYWKLYLEAAQQVFGQSWQYSDKMLESKYNEARCKLLLGNADGAIDDLETVITLDEEYAIKAAVDSDFAALGEKYDALILKLRTALVPNVLRRFDSYNALRARYLSFDGVLPRELVPLETELQRWLDVNPNAEESKYVDLRRIERGIGECSAMISAGLDHVLGKGA